MNYNFVFDTESAYLSAKASGGSVYSALCTNSAGYRSRSAISFCKDTGKTYIDSVNVLVEREYGQIGDCLLYNTNTSTYCWLKSNAAWDATSKGSCTVNDTDLTAAGYKKVGFMLHKREDDCLLLSCANTGYYKYAEDTSTAISGVTTYSYIARENNSTSTYNTWIASGSCYWAEQRYGQTVNQYSWPLPRYYWDLAKEAAYANTAASGEFTNGSYTVTAGDNGMGTASITYKCTEGSVTIDPADFDWNFDKWYRKKVLLRFPASSGCMQDFDGRKNTKALVTSDISTPAADACYAYAVADVPDFAAGKWWLPSIVELWYMLVNIKILRAKGCPITISYYWSSTQASATTAWYVHVYYAGVYGRTKPSSYFVRSVAAFKP